MQVRRTSVYSGVTRTRELPITEEQMAAYRSGVNAQYAFSDLPAADREFIISGMTQEEWNEAFGDEETDASASHTAVASDEEDEPRHLKIEDDSAWQSEARLRDMEGYGDYEGPVTWP